MGERGRLAAPAAVGVLGSVCFGLPTGGSAFGAIVLGPYLWAEGFKSLRQEGSRLTRTSRGN